MRDREKARQKAKELVAQMTLEERASQLRYDACLLYTSLAQYRKKTAGRRKEKGKTAL